MSRFDLRMRQRAWMLLPAWAIAMGSCRGETPPGPVVAAVSDEVDAPPPDEPAVQTTPRALWFTQGPGLEAIVARERRDYEAAAKHLDALLAQPGLSQDDRAAAQWLRALEDLRLERYQAAADRFAQARNSDALAPVELRLRWREAQARLSASDPKAALELVESVPAQALADSPLRDDYIVVEADARNRTDDFAGAEQAYLRYLKAFPNGKRKFEVMAKLARMLSGSDDDEVAKRALPLYERLLLQSPLSDYGQEAAAAEPKLRARLGLRRDAAASKTWQRELAVARVDAELGRRRYVSAAKNADAILRDSKLTPMQRCHALYVKGTAIFKQRKRTKSRPVFDQAAKVCQTAGKVGQDLEVKTRYQGARGLYAEGKYAKAAKAFTALATEFPKHSYSDDAWVLAGESWLEDGSRGKEAEAYRRALEVGGDMGDEALRRLLLLTFDQGDAAGVVRLCDDALGKKIAKPNVRAKLHYFRGRAHQRTGDPKAAVKDWVATVQAEPLGYPAMQALSRLREQGEDALRQGLDVLGEAAAAESAPDPAAQLDGQGGGAQRALVLARLGLGDPAREELAAAKVEGWPAVAVLDRAGLYPEGQRLLANMGSRWRTTPPGADNVRHWHLAHPRPFLDLIVGNEGAFSVPHLLAYGVMQTESLFDPGVTSYAGARGLIQLMPATAQGVATKLGMSVQNDDLFDPTTNLRLGMKYLGDLVARFGGGDAAVALAVPSYNAGAGAVDRWLAERGHWDLDLFIEAIPYDETRHYTQRVLGRWWAYRWLYGPGDPMQRAPAIPLQIPSGIKKE